MSYEHFKSFQRNELSILLQAKVKKKDIAKLLNKNRTSVWREIQRNKIRIGSKKRFRKNINCYDAGEAKKKTVIRRIKANQRFRKIENNNWLKRYIIKKIKLYWSPDEISGRLEREYKNDKTKWIGKDSIYQFIYTEHPNLVKYLRHQKCKYRRKHWTNIRAKRREEAKKKRISERPIIIELRSRIGDWEGDTIVGKEKVKQLLTHVDRKSGILLLDKLEKSTAEETRIKTKKRFEQIDKDKKYSLTYDNGTTFSEHELTERHTGMDIYFAYPYHSWERGTNENTNGLIRQFFPKKSSFANITAEDLKRVEDLINNRPRKRLNYLTPIEVFNSV